MNPALFLFYFKQSSCHTGAGGSNMFPFYCVIILSPRLWETNFEFRTFRTLKFLLNAYGQCLSISTHTLIVHRAGFKTHLFGCGRERENWIFFSGKFLRRFSKTEISRALGDFVIVSSSRAASSFLPDPCQPTNGAGRWRRSAPQTDGGLWLAWGFSCCGGTDIKQVRKGGGKSKNSPQDRFLCWKSTSAVHCLKSPSQRNTVCSTSRLQSTHSPYRGLRLVRV